jgi:hypothetical protein
MPVHVQVRERPIDFDHQAAALRPRCVLPCSSMLPGQSGGRAACGRTGAKAMLHRTCRLHHPISGAIDARAPQLVGRCRWSWQLAAAAGNWQLADAAGKCNYKRTTTTARTRIAVLSAWSRCAPAYNPRQEPEEGLHAPIAPHVYHVAAMQLHAASRVTLSRLLHLCPPA